MLAADTPDYVEQLNIYIIEEFMLPKSGNKPNPKRPREIVERNIRQRTGGIHEVCGEQEPALLDAYRQGVTWGLHGGVRQQEVHHASHGHRCLPASKLTKCMEVNEATFAEMAKASMLDIASVTADVVGHSGLGRDLDA
jgi:hypothetical protein